MKVAARSIRKKRVLTDHVCECGRCGLRTYAARETSKQFGYVKGEPLRFRHGHSKLSLSRRAQLSHPKPRPPVQFLLNNTVKIPLTKGYWATVDLADYPLVAGSPWIARVCSDRGSDIVYAARNIDLGRRKRKEIFMHQIIVGSDPSIDVDHRDHDGLNNRRGNLRVAGVLNMRNVRKLKALTSKYKGVCLRSDSGRWRARIFLNGKNVTLGSFRSEAEAARAYDKAALLHYGEYACINFPKTA